MNCSYIGRELYIEISDSGVGIQDVAKQWNRYTHPNHSLTDQAWVFIHGSIYGRAHSYIRTGTRNNSKDEKIL